MVILKEPKPVEFRLRGKGLQARGGAMGDQYICQCRHPNWSKMDKQKKPFKPFAEASDFKVNYVAFDKVKDALMIL